MSATALVEVKGPVMKREEAEELIEQFNSSVKDMRGTLLRLFEGKAHKALKYGDFETFARERLNINVSDRTINNHLLAARVERQLLLAAPEKETAIYSLPVTAAVDLAKLPKDQWAEVFNEFEALNDDKEHAKRTPAEKQRWLGRIINRHLAAENKKSHNGAATLRKSGETPNVMVNTGLTPIVPATYDGSDEALAADAALEAGHLPSEVQDTVGTTVTIPVERYGLLVSFVRRMIQYYGSDGEAMSGLVEEAVAFIDNLEGALVD